MIFDPILDILRGKAVTIPPMDGALKPNTALETAEVVAEIHAPDNLCAYRGGLLCSAGSKLFVAEGGGQRPEELAQFDVPVTALAVSPRGDMAVGLDDGRLGLMLADGGTRELAAPGGLACPTALAFDGPGALYVAQGSARHRPTDWAVDLMERSSDGSVWRLDLGSGSAPACLARDLAFPHGLLIRDQGGSIVASESWRHRLVEIPAAGGAAKPILTKLPAYPARLAPAVDGGAWLAMFAPRSRLIEFVLLEDAYRADMMREIPREHWIAPALSSNASFLEPLQCGSVKTMGIHKPWSPARSYGLVVRLDPSLRPAASFHSRADGRRHGVTSVAEIGGRILVAAKGGNAILDIGSADGMRS